MKSFFKYSAVIMAAVLCMVLYGFVSSDRVTVAETAQVEYGECEQHIYKNNGEYTPVGEATCSKTATMYRKCVVCGYNDIFITPKNPGNHKNIASEWSYNPKPTCISGGVRYKSCNDCRNVVIQEELTADPDAHSAAKTGIVVTAPTCTTEGTKASECKYCGELFGFEAIPVNENNHAVTDKWTIVTLPTCNESGLLSGECDLCGKAAATREIAPTGAHTAGAEWFVDAEPTCVSDGSKSQHCTLCDTPCNVVVLPATPDTHNFSVEYIMDAEATCIAEGQMSKHCADCDAVTDIRITDINPSAHSYSDEWIVTKEPTCNKTGLKHQVCTLCGENSVSSMIATTEHNYPDEYEVIRESADGLSAQVKYVCTDCAYENITIVVFGSTDDNGGNMGDVEITHYPLIPVSGTLVKVDYKKLIVSNVRTGLTVEELMKNFTNSAMFAIYGADGSYITEADAVTTGVRFNYKISDSYSTDYVISVTGDIDGDGKISAADARLIIRAAAQLDELSGAYAVAADVNGDGKILASDARKTLRVAAGIERFNSTYGY